jgi:hypothetical protein
MHFDFDFAMEPSPRLVARTLVRVDAMCTEALETLRSALAAADGSGVTVVLADVQAVFAQIDAAHAEMRVARASFDLRDAQMHADLAHGLARDSLAEARRRARSARAASSFDAMS